MTSPPTGTPTPRDLLLDEQLGRLLRIGVTLAAMVVAFGGVTYLLRHGGDQPVYGRFLGEPSDLRSVPGIMRSAAALTGRGIIQLGLLLLIATPIARVVFSIAAFGRRRDWMYVCISMTVLALLAVSLSGVVR
jgi:uncharacterized membrane protein